MIRFWVFVFFLFPALAHATGVLSLGGLEFIETHPSVAVLGLGLIILEFMLPTKGLLGILGIAFFALGTSGLATNPNDMLRLTWAQIIILNVIVVGTALLVLMKTIRDYRTHHPAVTEPLRHRTATVVDWMMDSHRVEVGGAIWLAHSDVALFLQPGDKVKIVGQDNLTLIVTGA